MLFVFSEIQNAVVCERRRWRRWRREADVPVARDFVVCVEAGGVRAGPAGGRHSAAHHSETESSGRCVVGHPRPAGATATNASQRHARARRPPGLNAPRPGLDAPRPGLDAPRHRRVASWPPGPRKPDSGHRDGLVVSANNSKWTELGTRSPSAFPQSTETCHHHQVQSDSLQKPVTITQCSLTVYRNLSLADSFLLQLFSAGYTVKFVHLRLI